MRKRLLLLLPALWPLLAHAEPHYALPGILYVVEALFLVMLSLVVAQVVGRLLRWLLGVRPSLWLLSGAALLGCGLGWLYRPQPRQERPESLSPNTVVAVSGDYVPPPSPPGPWVLAACAAGAVVLVVAGAAWRAKRQWPTPDE